MSSVYIESSPVSEGPKLRSRLAAAILWGHFLLSASQVPEWRTDPRQGPAVVLLVGAPVQALP
jgi:hypothetical protein